MAEGLTVIVVAVAGGEALRRCAAAVRSQEARLLVVSRDGAIIDDAGKKVGDAAQCNIPFKRKTAVELARTPLVALIEDTVVPKPGWSEAVVAALNRHGVVACAGPVSIAAGLPPSSRALALSEYGSYNDGKPAGTTDSLPGCNFAFRRASLLEAMHVGEGLVDQLTFRRLRDQGGELLWAPAMAVTFCHANQEGARLKSRFQHGRIYASSGDGRGAARRGMAAAKALLLPPVLTMRSLRHASSREIQSVPTIGWLIVQNMAWATGELAGALFGPSAKGLSQWQ